MAGRHARMAPVVISRALATLLVSALLLAVGVVAMTVLTGGEGPATGGPRAGAPTVAPDASVVPTPTSPGEPSGSTSSGPGGGEAGGIATPLGQLLGDPSRLGIPSGALAASVQLPAAAPGVATSPRGWVQRSDAGRAHGRAIGLLGRGGGGHGCRPVATKARPVAAQAEPVACR